MNGVPQNIVPPAGTVLVCLHEGTGFIGDIIRWQTRGVFSHASIVCASGRHFEAREFRGVLQHPSFTLTADEKVSFFTVPVTLAQAAAIEAFLNREVGAPYDYVMVWHFVTRGGPVRGSQTRWFCSELVFAALAAAGIDLLRAQAWEVSPVLLSYAPALEPYTPAA